MHWIAFVLMAAALPCHADAEDQASDMLDLDFEIPEVEKNPIRSGRAGDRRKR